IKSGEFVQRPGEDAAELPLMAEGGKLRPEASEPRAMLPRAAACVLDDGTFVVATTTFDTDEPNAKALVELGCRRVGALHRGSHFAASLHRAGTDTPLEKRYESTTLYAFDEPMRGRAAPF